MSIDMSEFYQVFFEEAAELLEEMETLLVDLDIENPNLEDMNAIFRHLIRVNDLAFHVARLRNDVGALAARIVELPFPLPLGHFPR